MLLANVFIPIKCLQLIINWYCLSYFQAKGQTIVKVTQIQNVCFEQGWFNDAVGQ